MNVKILEVHDFSFEANHIVEATIMRSSVKDGIPCFDKAYAYAVQDENPYEKSENEVKYGISESSAYEQYELYVLLDEMRGEMETGCKDYGDEYSDLLLLSISTPSNDRRLGGNEAPPAIVSIYLGELLTEILE